MPMSDTAVSDIQTTPDSLLRRGVFDSAGKRNPTFKSGFG